MQRVHGFWGVILFSISFFVASFGAQAAILETVFTESWEGGQGDWDVSNGVWEVGMPTDGPGDCYGGGGCAGTILNGFYPVHTDSRLISPAIDLPAVNGMEEVRLRFWQWFSYHSGDSGVVQVSEFDPVDGWSAFETVSGSMVNFSGGWSRTDVELTAFAGKKVRIGFLHTAVNADPYGADESSGWFIDDLSVIKVLPEFNGDFEGAFLGDVEGGWGDWSASRGVWQVGMPTSGPDACYSGDQCAGTRLDANYPVHTDSRFISAPIELPSVTGMEEVRLRFWQWFSYHSGDSAVVQVSEFDPADGWSAFETISGSMVNFSGGWSRTDVELTAFAGKKVRIGFLHTAVNADPYGADESSGWFIDDLSVIKVLPEFNGDFEGEFPGDVEGGWGDWSASRGVWQVGMPTSGPDACYSGDQCAGTRLDANYPVHTDSRFISAPIELPSVTGMEEVRLRFWQWFSYHSGDSAVVQVSEFDPVDGWSEFQTVSGSMLNYSGGWSRTDVELTAFAGKKVRIGFLHTAVNADPYGADESSGWFIDDLSLIKKVPDFFIDENTGIEYGDFEGAFVDDVNGGWGDWSASRGVWQVGLPTVGPGDCLSGYQCVGTRLDANYPVHTDSRLISPPIQLPEDNGTVSLRLRFWHWHSYHSGDSGMVQISEFDPVDGWSAWDRDPLPDGGPFVSVSGGWTRKTIDLLLYAGKKVRIGFLHAAVNADPYGADESSGWFIDNIKLPGVFLRACEGDFDNDGDVDGSDSSKFSSNFGRRDCSLQDFCEADFDNDGDVDGSDLSVFSEDFGETQCFELDPFS